MEHATSEYRVVHREDQDWRVCRDGDPEPVSRGFASQDSAIDYARGRAEHDQVALVIEDAHGTVIATRSPSSS